MWGRRARDSFVAISGGGENLAPVVAFFSIVGIIAAAGVEATYLIVTLRVDVL